MKKTNYLIITAIIIFVILKLKGTMDFWLNSFMDVPTFSENDTLAKSVEVITANNNVLALSKFIVLLKNIIVLIILFFTLQMIGKFRYIEKEEVKKVIMIIGLFLVIDITHFHFISMACSFGDTGIAIVYLCVISRTLKTKVIKEDERYY